MKLYKFLRAGGEPTLGTGRWSTPVNTQDGWTPGEWREVEGKLVACENALHGCREEDLLGWISDELYLMEYAEPPEVHENNKVYGRKARLLSRVETWDERTARLFACDCTERVLPIFERRFPDDPRPRQAIATARRYADGEATADEVIAARDAAWAATRITTWDAAWAAARITTWDARAAARDAAWTATRDAAWTATTRDAERKWQQARLMEYIRGEAS